MISFYNFLLAAGEANRVLESSEARYYRMLKPKFVIHFLIPKIKNI
jgi:hypothetical protein